MSEDMVATRICVQAILWLQTRRGLVISDCRSRVNLRTSEFHRTTLCIVKTPFTHNYRGAGNPDATVPISVKRVSGSRVPLNSGRNAASVYGQRTLGEPL